MTSFVASEVSRNRHHEHEATKDEIMRKQAEEKKRKMAGRLTLALTLYFIALITSVQLSLLNRIRPYS